MPLVVLFIVVRSVVCRFVSLPGHSFLFMRNVLCTAKRLRATLLSLPAGAPIQFVCFEGCDARSCSSYNGIALLVAVSPPRRFSPPAPLTPQVANLLSSMRLLGDSSASFADRCVSGTVANR